MTRRRLLALLEAFGDWLGNERVWIVLPKLRTDFRSRDLIFLTGVYRGPFTSRRFAQSVAQAAAADYATARASWVVVPMGEGHHPSDAPLGPDPVPPETPCLMPTTPKGTL